MLEVRMMVTFKGPGELEGFKFGCTSLSVYKEIH